MRRELFRSGAATARELLRRAPYLHLATTTPEGAPVLRALDAAVLEDAIYFHGAPTGEKARCVGRPAVVSAEELVAHVPSWMVEASAPSSACSASTFYRSVQVHGTLREVTGPAEKARALEALLARWQPERGYRRVDPEEPACAGALRGTLVLAVAYEQVDGKAKLGQGRSADELHRILEGLWRRGAPGDARAIEAIREANPGLAPPAFLAGGDGLTLHAALSEEDEGAAAVLLARTEWWAAVDPARIGPVQRASTAWVGARTPTGRLVATARAQSDGRCAWLYDLVVAEDARGRGLGGRLLAFLLDHPAVRGCELVRLATRDARGLYARFGFVETAPRRGPGAARDLVLVRGPSAA